MSKVLVVFLVWLGFAVGAAAQTVAILPNAMTQFVDGNGAPYAGGRVFMYVPQTTTPKATYQDPLGKVPNQNPITLDANGRAVVWGTGEYRQVLQDLYGRVVWDQLTYASPVNPGATGTTIWYGTATGTANAIALNVPAGFIGSDGQAIAFIASATNTGATTINASGFGSIVAEANTSFGPAALSGGEIVAGNLYYATYVAGLNAFVLQNTVAPSISVLAYLPAGQPDGHTDNSAGFQAAATAMCARASNGGTIVVPAPLTGANYVAHDINNPCGNLWEGAGPGGVGSSNQTATGAILRGGTSINYSGATNYFMRWQVPGFPAFKSGGHINGGGITNMSLFDGSSTATALVSEGTQDWKATYVVMNGAYNGVFLKGDEFPVTSHISMYGTRSANYTIVGDLSGQTVSGAACSVGNGDCSTRNDAWYGEYLNNIDNTQTNTVFTITGFVATTTLSHTTAEGPSKGMVVSCPAGLDPNMGQCPQFGRFDDIQIEFFHTAGVRLIDTLNNYFDHLYSVGDATATASNAFYAIAVNYAGAAPPGRIQVTNSQLFATWGDCAFIGGTMYDITFINDDISGCNTANNNASGIRLDDHVVSVKILNNTFGQVDGYGGAFPLFAAVNINSTATANVEVHGNLFNQSGGVGYAFWNGSSYVQTSPVWNLSTQPSVYLEGNHGPGLLSTAGACGTGPALAHTTSDLFFTVNVGTGTPSSCTWNFANIQPVAPSCVVVSNSGVAISSIDPPTTTSVTWNGSLTGNFTVSCRLP